MRRTIRFPLAALMAIAFAAVMAQDAAPLDFDDIVGEWNLAYEDGETGTFDISRNNDGTPMIKVTTEFGQSNARDIVIEDDGISFWRDVNFGEDTLKIDYTATLVDGKLEGIGKFILPSAGSGPGSDQSTRFTAIRTE